MPFIPHTPESLIQRSDSKNPATTCKGITASGRPCRRPLGTSPQASPATPRRSKNGVIAILEEEDDEHDGAAAFFCWQHQDQAETLINVDQNERKVNIVSLQQRNSIDSLVERLGVVDSRDDETPLKKEKTRHHTRPARKETLPQKWQDMDGSLLAVSGKKHRGRSEVQEKQLRGESNLALFLFCCVRSADRDPLPPPRARKDSEKAGHSSNETSKLPSSQSVSGRNPSYTKQRTSQTTTAEGSPIRSSTSRPNEITTGNGRPLLGRDRPSQTEDFLSLMPKTLPPHTTALLLAELAKPISQHDEKGFIYMFWLTDASTTTPEPQAASSLLADNLPSTPNGRRKSDFLQAHTAASEGNSRAAKQATILLKIGRASNVQRRMNEWTRQCGYNLSLIRFYPHVPSALLHPSTATAPTSPSNPQKVLHAHKVERLIHLELADQRLKRGCESCGKEHREWFEVESSREGLKRVDDVIRRWTEWGRRVSR